jgi:hypothetical protein
MGTGIRMTSVLNGGGIGYQGTNPVRNEINKLQRQLDEIKKDNTYLLTALFKVAPDVITEYERIKQEETERVRMEAERAAAEARIAAQQAQAFNSRMGNMGGSGATQGTYTALYGGRSYK